MDEQSKILGIIKTQILALDDELQAAKIQFADSSLAENDWQCKNDRRMKCKVLEGQIAVLQTLEREMVTMFTKQFVTA